MPAMLSKTAVECPQRLLAMTQALAPVRTAVVGAGTPLVLAGVRAAVEHEIVEPVLIGEHREIVRAAQKIDWPVADMHLLTAGLDYVADSVDSLVPYDASSRDNLGAFGQWQGSYGRQEVVAALRWDNNEQFGSHSTGSMDYALLLDQGLRLNAGYGTAFKAPSLR